MAKKTLQAKLKRLPLQPGVYLMRDAQGEVIYVGKALRLRERVRSYFQAYPQRHDPKVQALAQQVTDVEIIVTRSEVEALVLEDQLIKSHRPRFNVRLKDDKRFPYLKITLGEPFPRLEITRRVARDGARYFGPYTRPQLVRETLNALRRCFPVRTCADDIQGRPTRRRPCLDFFLKMCPAPCVQAVSSEAYRAQVAQLCRFLGGRPHPFLKGLEAEMAQAAAALNFERAAHLRDALAALKALTGEGRALSAGALAARDVVGLALEAETCAVQVFFVREGAIQGRERFFLEVPAGSTVDEVLSAFLTQFYAEAAVIPREVVLPHPLEQGDWVERWLSERAGRRVRLVVPRRGPKRNLLKLAARNAELALFEHANRSRQRARRRAALDELQSVLGLPQRPQRIECYDISNLQGRDAVGAMVVFEEGLPHRAGYRRFRIQRAGGPDDFAMMAEVVRRRFRRGLHEREALSAAAAPGAMTFAAFPDLIVIDGGKGQLGAARQVLEELNLADLPLVALAKRQEEVFRPGRREPLILPRDSAALQLLQHLRDEAHRFGLAYHRSLRQRRTVRSALDDVPGVGPKRRAQLLKRFGSVQRIGQASLEELESVPGLPVRVARQVYLAFHPEEADGSP